MTTYIYDKILIEGFSSGKYNFFVNGYLNDVINLAGNPITFTSKDLHLRLFTWDNKFAPKLLKATWDSYGQIIHYYKIGKKAQKAALKTYERDKKKYEKYEEDLVLGLLKEG